MTNKSGYLVIIFILLLLLPISQQINAPDDRRSEVVNILKETGYYQNHNITSINFVSRQEVTRICELPPGRIAIGCTQPHYFQFLGIDITQVPYEYDIWIALEDSDWRHTLRHEIGHVKGYDEAGADKFMNQ